MVDHKNNMIHKINIARDLHQNRITTTTTTKIITLTVKIIRKLNLIVTLSQTIILIIIMMKIKAQVKEKLFKITTAIDLN